MAGIAAIGNATASPAMTIAVSSRMLPMFQMNPPTIANAASRAPA